MERQKAARGERRSTEAGDHAGSPSAINRPVLLVEDSKFSARLIKKSIATSLRCEVVVAYSAADARVALERGPETFLAAVTDLDLPDAPNGEVIDLLLDAGVATIVLTASYDEKTRERILGRGIVDYHIKGVQSLVLVNETLRRLIINPEVTVLIVDDSGAYRKLLRGLLEAHRFQVLEAEDGVEGLAMVEAHPEINLVITDFEMPNMDGVELVGQIRALRSSEELVILGASSVGSGALSARFLKFGADDFINKPFLNEEFYCRIYHGLKMLEHIQAVQRAAFTDQLTQLDNRLSFFRTVPDQYERAKSEEAPLTVAMIDIDFFKKINDTYGHAGGDVALRHLAALLRERLGSCCFVARFGGEEFCIVAEGLGRDEAESLLERLRESVEASEVHFEDEIIRFTLSVGFTTTFDTSLDDMINRADEALYLAKETGRNQVVFKE